MPNPISMEEITTTLRNTLIQHADEKTRATMARYFKEGEKALVHGVKATEVRSIGKAFYKQLRHKSKREILDGCDALWRSGYLEEAIVACIWSESLHKKYEPADFAVFEHWVNDCVSNWADCDTLCNHTIGTFVMSYPPYVQELKRWAKSPGRWVRRASAVTLIVPARKGLFLQEIFEIADILLLDRDDMVQKGYGWMLKAASQSNEAAVFDYVMAKKEIMPRTAFRYAIEKMPEELKKRAMERPTRIRC